ncbi:MAG: flippase-like domain-containing protein [Bacteroides sp.]|nr:flippase-like domain-containing protein [Bacteroides sp.]
METNQPTPPSNEALNSSAHKAKSTLKKYISDTLRYVIPLGISVGMILWLFHKVDFHEVIDIIHKGCNFWWIGLMMLITTLSHMVRGTRWGLQLRAAGVKRMPIVCEWVTIWGAYALNLLFPQLGEGWRCVFVSRRQKAPLSTVIGTDIGDRSSDLAVILCLICLSLVVAHPFIMDFMMKYAVGRDVKDIAGEPLLWLGLGGIIAIAWYITHYLRTYKWVQTLDTNLSRIWDGFKVIFTMKHRWLYLLFTIGIWTCYFFETYVCFFAFDFTRDLIHDPHMALGFIPGLVVFVFGSVSMAIPSNGGLGPWNLAVMFGLSLFGISSTEGTAFSIVMWSCQAVMLIILGLFSLAYVTITSKKTKSAIPPQAA